MTDDPIDRVAALEAGARRAGEALARAFGDGAAEGRRLEGVLDGLERSLAGLALRGAAGAAAQAAGGALASLAGSLTGLSVPAPSPGQPPFERWLGARDAPARGAPAPRPVSVTMQIATPDAASFRRSEAQVAAGLARAVARGARGM